MKPVAANEEGQETIWTENSWAFDNISGASLTNSNDAWNPVAGVFSYNIIPNSTAATEKLQVRLLVDAKRGTTVDPISNTLIANVNQSLEAGKIYKMTYEFSEENVGPWDPANTQCVLVKVTVSSWVVVPLTPTFE